MRNTLLTIAVLGLSLGGVSPSTAEAAPRAIDEPRFDELPVACSYLTEELAKGLLRAERVKASAANEHISILRSNCEYSGKGVKGRKVGFTFRFMVYDMFDVDALDPMQLEFNAMFAAGGIPMVEKLDDLGKVSFVFEQRDRTVLMVVTGIQGPLDGAQRPSEFVANYYLNDPDNTQAVRLDKLLAHARRHLDEWLRRP